MCYFIIDRSIDKARIRAACANNAIGVVRFDLRCSDYDCRARDYSQLRTLIALYIIRWPRHKLHLSAECFSNARILSPATYSPVTITFSQRACNETSSLSLSLSPPPLSLPLSLSLFFFLLLQRAGQVDGVLLLAYTDAIRNTTQHFSLPRFNGHGGINKRD